MPPARPRISRRSGSCPTSRALRPVTAKTFTTAEKRGALRLVASPDGALGSVTVHADAALYAGLLDGQEAVTQLLNPLRKTYVHLVRGALRVNGQPLAAGDAALLENGGRPWR